MCLSCHEVIICHTSTYEDWLNLALSRMRPREAMVVRVYISHRQGFVHYSHKVKHRSQEG